MSTRKEPSHGGGKSTVSAALRWASFLLVLAPFALGLAFVRLFGVDVPHYDTWSVVPLFEKLSSGTLTLRDLFAQHNEHRIFFPRIVMLSLGTVTAFDNVAIMHLAQGCLAVTSIVLLLAFRTSVRANLLFFVPIPFLVFTWGQIWNMLQAFQITLVFAQTFGVLTFYLLYLSGYGRPRKFAFCGALGSAAVASFSAGPGLLTWPVGLAQLLVSPVEKGAKRFLMGAWSLVGVAVWALYFYGYERPGNTSPRYLTEQPLASAEFFLSVLGAALFRHEGFVLAVGLVMACLGAGALFSVCRRGTLGECSFWIAVLAFSFLVLAATTVARGGSGVEGSLTPKYVTFSVLAVVALYALLVRSTLERRKPGVVLSLGVVAALVAASIPVSYVEGFTRGERLERAKERAAFVLATYESQPDEVMKRFFRNHPEVSRERAAVLRTLGYSVFSGLRPQGLPPPLSTLFPVQSGALSDVQTIAGVRVGPQDQPLVIPEGASSIEVSGWAVDAGAGDTAGGVYVLIDDRPFAAFYGTSTPGVAERLGSPAYEYAGFERAIPLSEVGPGEHELSIIVVTNDEEGYYLSDTEVVLEVER